MQGALDDFLSAGQALSVFGTTNPAVMRWRSMAGLAAHALGDTRLASDLIDQELHLAHAFDRSPDIGAALRAKATLASGARRESLLRESLAMLENADSALDLAATLCCLGVEIRRGGQRTRSREPLSRAMDIAHRNGAVALARRAREELLASGAKPRRPTMTGVGSLTPTELRVAGLAAEGLTNPEIAVKLYLAKSTVAWHLRHIFLKLNIESRNDLVRVFAKDLATDNGPLELRTVG
jgi:DNA-binding CsgD family transcriptional regulator